MALGRQIFTTHDIVLPYDPAIDEVASDLKRHRSDTPRFAARHIVPKAGQKVSVFSVSGLSDQQKRVLHLGCKDTDSYEFAEACFRCGILGVRDYPIIDGDSCVEISQPDRKDRPPLGECASPEWASRLAHSDVELLGAAIWGLSEARPLS